MKLKILKLVTIIGLMGLFLGLNPSVSSAQCAMCKKSAENANARDDTSIASTLNQGVLYLLALPYLASGVLVYVWYRNNKIQNA